MWEKEEERKIKEKGRKKLVRNFRLRHTFEICYGEENSTNNFRGGGRIVRI